MLAIFSVMFIAAIIAFARAAGDAEVLQTRFDVRRTGPLMQSGNCNVNPGDASMAITAKDVSVRIVKSDDIIERNT